MSKKIFAIVVSFAMILTLLSASLSVFAEDKLLENPKLEEEFETTVYEEPAEEVETPAEEPEEVEETVVTEPEEKEEVTEEPAEEVKTPAEESEEVEETVVTEPEEKEDEVTEEPAEEVETPAEGTEVPEETVPEAPAEGEEPAPEEQPGEETGNTEGSPDPIEGEPEGANPDGSNFGGNNSPFEPPVIVVPESPVCSCGVNEGEAHEEGCPMYEAPVAPVLPVEGCTCSTLSEDPKDHAVDCPVFLATINRLPAAVQHSELYIRIMRCKTVEEILNVIYSTSEDELEMLSADEAREIEEYLKTFDFAESEEVEIVETVVFEENTDYLYDEDFIKMLQENVIYIEDDFADIEVAPLGAPVVGE